MRICNILFILQRVVSACSADNFDGCYAAIVRILYMRQIIVSYSGWWSPLRYSRDCSSNTSATDDNGYKEDELVPLSRVKAGQNLLCQLCTSGLQVIILICRLNQVFLRQQPARVEPINSRSPKGRKGNRRVEP
ncbi:uncharacterized protein LOC135147671 [Daucus carota subsp. sativus]|uniref:uncharacterized protein LOC135147671 n=1 Tax=Daucus carota subsp. sativus TaxID=79200 RepID=UPI0030836C3A